MHSLFFDVIYHSILGPEENRLNSDNDQMNLAYALFAIMVKVVTIRHSTGQKKILLWTLHKAMVIMSYLSVLLYRKHCQNRRRTRPVMEPKQSSADINGRYLAVRPLYFWNCPSLSDSVQIRPTNPVIIPISAKLWVKAWYDTYCSCWSNFKLIKCNRS